MNKEAQNSYRILVLDDDLVFRDLLASALMAWGYEVMMVARQSQAEGLVAELPFDLLIVDGMLPDGDGISFIEEVRKQGFQGEVLFVSAQSAFFDDEEIPFRLEFEYKVAEMLRKPLELDVLHDAVQALLPQTKREVKEKDIPTQLTPVPAELAVGRAPPTSPMGIAQLVAQKAEAYRPKLEDELLRLASQVRHASRWSAEHKDLLQALGYLHKLKGTAGSYGFEQVSAICKQLEDLLEPLRYGGSWDTSRQQLLEDKLQEALASLYHGAPPSLEAHTPSPTSVDLHPVSSSHSQFSLDLLDGELLSIRILVYDMEQSLFSRLLPLAARHNIQMDRVHTREELTSGAQELDCDLMLLRLYPFGFAPPQAAPPEPPESVDVAQWVRYRGHPAPMLFYGHDLSPSQRSLVAQVPDAYFIEQWELESEFLSSVLALHSTTTREATILLLGDDDELAEALSNSPGLTRLQVIPAKAKDLFLALEKASPHMVLVDSTTLQGDPLEPCKLLRTSVQWRYLPCFYLVGDYYPSIRASVFATGVEQILPKDDRSHLLTAIRNRLR